MGSYTHRMAKGNYRHHHFLGRIKNLFRFSAFVFFLFRIFGGVSIQWRLTIEYYNWI